MLPQWYDAVGRPRTFYTLQKTCKEHCIYWSKGKKRVSSLPDIAQQDPAVCLLKINVLTF
jgi:hypothetical protein